MEDYLHTENQNIYVIGSEDIADQRITQSD